MAAMSIGCGDFLEFQDALKRMRQIDDKIIYMLNAIIPTESFQENSDTSAKCKDLHEQIQSGHKVRELAITKCLNTSKEKINQLMTERDNGNIRYELIQELRKEQNTLRLLQSELNIEEIVKKHTAGVFRKKCGYFYKPASSNIKL